MSWKDLWNIESELSKWEIVHDSDEKSVRLLYVPDEDYSDKDVDIKLSYEEFEDLIKFIKRLDNE